MSRTGSGLEVSFRGGSFLGKRKSSTFWTSDFHSGCSKVSLGSNKFSSGSRCVGGCKVSDAINSTRFVLAFADVEATAMHASGGAQLLLSCFSNTLLINPLRPDAAATRCGEPRGAGRAVREIRCSEPQRWWKLYTVFFPFPSAFPDPRVTALPAEGAMDVRFPPPL